MKFCKPFSNTLGFGKSDIISLGEGSTLNEIYRSRSDKNLWKQCYLKRNNFHQGGWILILIYHYNILDIEEVQQMSIATPQSEKI